MAANYDLLTTQTTVQVLAPTIVLDVVEATIQTKPSGVIVQYWISKDGWDAGTAPALLDTVATGVEHIMSSQPVIGAQGSTQLDANGLLAEVVTFTVAYTPAGSKTGPLTVDVDVPIGDFDQSPLGGANYGLEDAASLIQAAYKQLEAAAAG